MSFICSPHNYICFFTLWPCDLDLWLFDLILIGGRGLVMDYPCGKFGNGALQSYMPKDGTTHTKLWFLIYLCALTQFSAYRDIAWYYGKEGRRRWPGSTNTHTQDTAESPTAARLTYSGWNSLGAMEKVPSTNNRSAVIRCSCSCDAKINVLSAAVDVGRCRESKRLPLSSPRSQCSWCPTDL